MNGPIWAIFTITACIKDTEGFLLPNVPSVGLPDSWSLTRILLRPRPFWNERIPRWNLSALTRTQKMEYVRRKNTHILFSNKSDHGCRANNNIAGYSRQNCKIRTSSHGKIKDYYQQRNDRFNTAKESSAVEIDRRQAVWNTGIATSMLMSFPAWAKLEIDSSGELFVPKSTMLGGGGADETRGISIGVRDRARDMLGDKNGFSRVDGKPIQTVYETRFIAYLSRFLLTFDPAARSWWKNNLPQEAEGVKLRFAEFAESVEVGLADYFAGPYGSYASVKAAKAGLNARVPATSSRGKEEQLSLSNVGDTVSRLFAKLLEKVNLTNKAVSRTASMKKGKTRKALTAVEAGRQGILNVLALLRARYDTKDAKIQLAILFSLISSPVLQPTDQITALLGEVDDASVDTVALSQESTLRGYAYEFKPKVYIDPPPTLGDQYKTAKAIALMRPTSRVLKIRVLDGGEGYTSAPRVTLSSPSGRTRRKCDAVALLDREGHVDSIVVLDPGFGYGASRRVPAVKIEEPLGQQRQPSNTGTKRRAARAVAELEYEVYAFNVTEKGNGYAYNQPPNVRLDPPKEDFDWSVTNSLTSEPLVSAVAKLENNLFNYSRAVNSNILERISSDATALLPLYVRPQFAEPMFQPGLAIEAGVERVYVVPGLPDFPSKMELTAELAALDPVFGGVGIAPVTKGALYLTASQYTRLALSGAICTVLVRTLLNPLELVKTKIQLANDEELIAFATRETSNDTLAKRIATSPEEEHNGNGNDNKRSVAQKSFDVKLFPRAERSECESVMMQRNVAQGVNVLSETERNLQQLKSAVVSDKGRSESSVKSSGKLGTMSVMRSLVKLRGPLVLFQSADITFLASLVFGSLGFGATELFRRSFTSAFFEENGSGQSEIILLLAAALACVVTSFAATPFEMIRVRSMGLVESKGWKEVLSNFLEEAQQRRILAPSSNYDNSTFTRAERNVNLNSTGISFTDISVDDVKPLWAAFSPIVSRELPFAISKFLAFDLVAKAIVAIVNSQSSKGDVQVGVGSAGLAISAISGAVAGIAGAVVSHPADLILTLTSAAGKESTQLDCGNDSLDGRSSTDEEGFPRSQKGAGTSGNSDWRPIVKELLRKEGGVGNLFVGLPARASFFFLVIGLQFFLYDYVKNLLAVGADDLSVVLDVFYAVRQGL